MVASHDWRGTFIQTVISVLRGLFPRKGRDCGLGNRSLENSDNLQIVSLLIIQLNGARTTLPTYKKTFVDSEGEKFRHPGITMDLRLTANAQMKTNHRFF